MKNVVISLYDLSGTMMIPWAEAGYECYCYDIQHIGNESKQYEGGGSITYCRMDLIGGAPIESLGIDPARVAFACSFSPCDHMSVSGARWFKGKGLRALADGIRMFATGAELFNELDCPAFAEHPVSTISSYFRKPDYTFHPHHWSGIEPNDHYTKNTCIWAWNDFVMPSPEPGDFELLGEPDDRIHKAAPSPERANFRSATPLGFARAVYEANK